MIKQKIDEKVREYLEVQSDQIMDTSKVYDVSEKQRKIAEWRDAKRKELRALYLKDSGHPTRTLLVCKLIES